MSAGVSAYLSKCCYSLNEARENYKKIGAISTEYLEYVRPASDEEK